MTVGPMNLTTQIATQAALRRWEDIPDPIREVARHAMLDWFGVALAGHRSPLVDRQMRNGTMSWRNSRRARGASGGNFLHGGQVVSTPGLSEYVQGECEGSL